MIFRKDGQTGITKLVVDFRRVHKIAKSDYYIHHVCLPPPARNKPSPTGRIFLKFDILEFKKKNLSRKFKFLLISSKNNECLHEDPRTFIIPSRRIFRMKNLSDKSCTENQSTHFTFNALFSPPEIVPFVRECRKI